MSLIIFSLHLQKFNLDIPSMDKRIFCLILSLCIHTLSIFAQNNPIINHMYTADPSAHVFNDTLWVFPSHDKDDALNFSMEDYHVYSTTDMLNWKDHGVIFNPIRDTKWAKSKAWAPDCIFHNGKYYLYYPTDQKHIGVAVSDHPDGPFHDPLGHPLISIDSPGVICDRDFIDPCVFVDDDGKAYLFMGQNTVCCICLNDDMISYDGKVHIIEGAEGFFEAIWVHKRNGLYYMSYSTSPFNGSQPMIAYCTSQSPLGPYKYQGIILDPVNSGTNHHSFVNYKGQDYLFYHTADLSKSLNDGFHNGVRRSICCDSLFYNPDGTIQKVKPTLNRDKLTMHDVPRQRREEMIAASIRTTNFRDVTFTLGQDNSRQALQALIDQCTAAGGGTVIIPSGTHYMDGPIELKNNVRLHLQDGAELIFNSNPDAYLPVVLTRWEGTEMYGRSSMIHAYGQTNVAITGEGNATINANGSEMAKWGMPMDTKEYKEIVHGTHGETPEKADQERLRQLGNDLVPVENRIFGAGTHLRPCAIEFNKCQAILIDGITLKNSPFWCLHPLYCEDVIVRNVTIDSHFPNNDGCDPESSRRVLIENCTFRTGDDAVAIKSGRDADGRRVNKPSENIIIRNCKFYSECNGLCIGSEMSGGVRNVFMHNIEIGNVKNALLFKSNLDRGGFIESVYVDSVRIGNCAGAVLRFETNYFGYRGGNFPARHSDFHINDVTAESSESYAIYYDGNDAEPISNISVKNFHVKKARQAHYLYKTTNCTFTNCSINKKSLPYHIEEDTERRQCDVW